MSTTPELMSPEALNDLTNRVVRAKRGEGEMPSEEEIREGLRALRGNRVQHPSTSAKAARAAASLPSDLNDLFK